MLYLRERISSADVLDELGNASVAGQQEVFEVFVKIAVYEFLLQLETFLTIGVVALAQILVDSFVLVGLWG